MLWFPRDVSPNTKQSQLTRAFGSAHLQIINIIHSPVGNYKVHTIGATGTEVSGDNGSLDCIVRKLVWCRASKVWTWVDATWDVQPCQESGLYLIFQGSRFNPYPESVI